VVPSGGPVFGPFILSDVLKLCKLLCAQNVKLEANDPRRLRKKPQDAQDDVTELFDLFDARFGVGKTQRIWIPKGGPPQFSMWVFVILPAFVVSWFLANF